MGWSQAQWVIQQNYNTALAGKHAQNTQEQRVAKVVATDVAKPAVASNQIAASEKRTRPIVGDVLVWGNATNREYKFIETVDGRDHVVGIMESNSHISVWYDSGELEKFVKDGSARIIRNEPVPPKKPEPAYVQPIKIAALPFKKHPDCKLSHAAMTQMCMNCETLIAGSMDMSDMLSATPDKKPRTGKPVPLNNGVGSAVFGSWNGRVPR